MSLDARVEERDAVGPVVEVEPDAASVPEPEPEHSVPLVDLCQDVPGEAASPAVVPEHHDALVLQGQVQQSAISMILTTT